eukprot:6187787-Pleurochrysis_carterae.AAC.2
MEMRTLSITTAGAPLRTAIELLPPSIWARAPDLDACSYSILTSLPLLVRITQYAADIFVPCTIRLFHRKSDSKNCDGITGRRVQREYRVLCVSRTLAGARTPARECNRHAGRIVMHTCTSTIAQEAAHTIHAQSMGQSAVTLRDASMST